MGLGKLRWGILGVAQINRRLIPALQRAATAELRAIASRSLDRAQSAARRDQIPVAYGRYEDLLDDPEIDAVYIPLPNSLHAHWTVEAARRGKHILCEKPLAANADEAQEMVQCCREHGVRLMDGFFWPHHPRTVELRRLIDSGSIGELRHVNGAFTFRLDMDPANIRLQPELAGGSLMDIGCYPVYGARWAFQAEPTRVFATAEWQGGVDVTMSAVMEFPGGRTALINCGFTTPFRGYLEMVGTERTVTVADMWLPGPRATYRIHRPDDSVEKEIGIEGADQIVCMVDNFGQAVLEGREPSPSPDQAVQTMRVLDALRESARTGRPVSL